MCRPRFPMMAANSTSQSSSYGDRSEAGRAIPLGAVGVVTRLPTLVSWGCTMSSKGPVMALGNLLKMMGSLGTFTACSWQWSW